jgi:hypothetical protein
MNDRILSFDEIALGLKDKRLYLVAKQCFVSYPVLRRLAAKHDQSYTTTTLKRVSAYILKNTPNLGDSNGDKK